MPERDIESIYQAYSRMVYWAAYGACGTQSDALDAMQNTFMRAMAHMEQLQAMNEAQLKGWLYRVAVNLCRDAGRKQRREAPSEEPVAPDTAQTTFDMPEAAAIGKEERSQLRRAIDELPDIYRQTVLLHYFSGFDYKEIARLMGTTEGNVKSRMSRAKQRLYDKLKQGGEAHG